MIVLVFFDFEFFAFNIGFCSRKMPKYISKEIKKPIVEAKQKGETDQEVADRFHVNQIKVPFQEYSSDGRRPKQ
jgi:hypothetical protein